MYMCMHAFVHVCAHIYVCLAGMSWSPAILNEGRDLIFGSTSVIATLSISLLDFSVLA